MKVRNSLAIITPTHMQRYVNTYLKSSYKYTLMLITSLNSVHADVWGGGYP